MNLTIDVMIKMLEQEGTGSKQLLLKALKGLTKDDLFILRKDIQERINILSA